MDTAEVQDESLVEKAGREKGHSPGGYLGVPARSHGGTPSSLDG